MEKITQGGLYWWTHGYEVITKDLGLAAALKYKGFILKNISERDYKDKKEVLFTFDMEFIDGFEDIIYDFYGNNLMVDARGLLQVTREIKKNVQGYRTIK
jgi:hypothetical protein